MSGNSIFMQGKQEMSGCTMKKINFVKNLQIQNLHETSWYLESVESIMGHMKGGVIKNRLLGVCIGDGCRGYDFGCQNLADSQFLYCLM